MGADQAGRSDVTLSCEACGAKCCRYVATQIDAPTCKRDYDFIRWYLLHQKVNVFIDHNGDWFLEFETPCEKLDDDNRCGGYEIRPEICRQHGVGDADCEFHGDTDPYRIRFQSPEALEDWLTRRGIDWRFKSHAIVDEVQKRAALASLIVLPSAFSLLSSVSFYV